jgi:hypothetical protein
MRATPCAIATSKNACGNAACGSITPHRFFVMPFSDGFAINTIARAHWHGVAETTVKGPGGDDGCAPAGAAGDAIHTGGVEGFGHAHRRQDGGQAARQHRLPRPKWPQKSARRTIVSRAQITSE